MKCLRLLVALSFFPMTAVAGQTILVVPVLSGGEVDDDVLASIERGLQQDGFELLDLANAERLVEERLVLSEPTFDVSVWNEEIDAGVSAYMYTSWQEAIKLLEKALLPVFEEPEILAFNPEMVARAWEGGLTLVRTYMVEGQSERVWQWMNRLVVVFPGVKIDTQRHPPEVVRLHAAIQKEVLASAPSVTIEVVGAKADSCTISLNGALIGQGPVLQLQLPRGRHFVRAECDGERSWVRVLEVEDMAVNLLFVTGSEQDLSLTPRPALNRSDPDDPMALLPTARMLSDLTGAELFLFVGYLASREGVSSQYLQISVCNGASGVLLGSVRLPAERLNDEAALKQVLVSAFGGPAAEEVLVFDGEMFRASERPADESIDVWAWTTFGVGLALVVGGALSCTLGELDHQALTDVGGEHGISEMTRTEALDLEESGDAKKLAGYVLLGVGGAVLVGSAVLFLVDSSDEEMPVSVGLAPMVDGGLFSVWGRF